MTSRSVVPKILVLLVVLAFSLWLANQIGWERSAGLTLLFRVVIPIVIAGALCGLLLAANRDKPGKHSR